MAARKRGGIDTPWRPPWRQRRPAGESPAEFQRRLEEEALRHIDVLEMLAARYGVSRDVPDFWQRMFWAVANEYVPALTVKTTPERGRPGIWDATHFAEIDRLVSGGKSKSNAAQIVAKKSGGSGSSLLRRWREWHKNGR